ncbi:ArsR/SmtB family transcription factor [Myroides sp. LJL110]
MNRKQAIDIGKCLSNETRLEILEWLKDPDGNFPQNSTLVPNSEGVCVTFIFEKAGLSQSTISNYLSSMERCGLLEVKRVGKWTYFRRNQNTIEEYMNFII